MWERSAAKAGAIVALQPKEPNALVDAAGAATARPEGRVKLHFSGKNGRRAMKKIMHVCATLGYIEARAREGTSLLAYEGQDLPPAEVLAEIALLKGKRKGERWLSSSPSPRRLNDWGCPPIRSAGG